MYIKQFNIKTIRDRQKKEVSLRSRHFEMMIRNLALSSRNKIKSNEALHNLILTYASLALCNQREKQFSHHTIYT